MTPSDQHALREALVRAEADPRVYAGPQGVRTLGQWRAEAGLAAVAHFMASLIAERFKWQELAALHEELKDAAIREGATWRLRALAAEAENTRLKETVEAARTALKPFARAASEWDPEQNAGHAFYDTENVASGETSVTVGHLRRARSVLATIPPKENP